MKRVGICPISKFFRNSRNGTKVTQSKKPKNGKPKIILTWHEIEELKQEFLKLIKCRKTRRDKGLSTLRDKVAKTLELYRQTGRKVPKRKIDRMEKLLIEINAYLFL